MRPIKLPIRGCHPLWRTFPGPSGHSHGSAGPRSLATTKGVSVDFLSSGYLDVSVPRVRFLNPMYSGPRYLVMPVVDYRTVTTTNIQVGFPIRRSMDQSLFPAPHGLSQGITSFIASCCQGIHQTPLSRLIRSRRRQALLREVVQTSTRRLSLVGSLDPSALPRQRRHRGCEP